MYDLMLKNNSHSWDGAAMLNKSIQKNAAVYDKIM